MGVFFRKSLILWSLGATSCGLAPLPKAVDGPTPPPVVKATADDIAKGRALGDSYIVTFRPPLGGPGLGFASFDQEYRAHFDYLQANFLNDPRVKDIRFLTSLDLREAVRSSGAAQDLGMPAYLTQLAAEPGLAPDALAATITQVDFADAAAASATLDDWGKQGALWFAEPNYISRVEQATPPANLFTNYATSYGSLNTDFYWWITKINLVSAYQAIAARDTTQPNTPSDQDLQNDRPIIAVLDSGVDYQHPALKNRIWQNTDVNASGCVNDYYGCNTTTAFRGSLGDGNVWPFAVSGPGIDCGDADDNCSHGTHVAGLIAADESWTDPASGHAIPGVCPVCQIMILKIVSQVGSESGILDSSIIAAFKYVTLFRRSGSAAVRVMNASFGKFVRTRSVGLMIRLMRDQNGAVLVAAAGNEDTITREYPAAFADAISVAAVDQDLRKDNFSNFGRWVSISAPGDQMLSTVPGSRTDTKSGTSMATPMVAGVAGLMLARYPNMGFDDLKNAILQGADPTFYRPDANGGFNYNWYYPQIAQDPVRQPLLGYGVLNANAAINRTPSQGLPIYTALDRVEPGCAVLGAAAAGGRGLAGVLLALGLAAPLLTAAGSAYKRQVKRAMLR